MKSVQEKIIRAKNVRSQFQCLLNELFISAQIIISPPSNQKLWLEKIDYAIFDLSYNAIEKLMKLLLYTEGDFHLNERGFLSDDKGVDF